MKKGIKITFWVLVIIGLLAGFIYNYSKGINVDTYEIEKRNYSQYFKENGTAVSDKSNSVYSLTNGKIISFNINEGDIIKKGTLIASMENTELDYQIRKLQSQIKSLDAQKLQSSPQSIDSQVKGYNLQIENLKSQLASSEKDLDRTKSLYHQGIVSEIEYEKSKQNVDNIKNSILQQQNNIDVLKEKTKAVSGTNEYYESMKESINTEIESLNYQKSKGNIYSPMNGTVKSVHVKNGTVVSQGTPLIEIFSNDKYKIETYLLTKDIFSITVGMNVDCILKTREKDLAFNGIVEKIAPAAEDKISSLGLKEERIKVTINPDLKDVQIRPGYNFDIKFTTYNKDNCIFITKSALFPYKDGKAVWVIRDSKAYIQPVKTGVEDNKDIVIESGLNKGDIIILDYSIKGLKEGKKVY